MLVGGHLQMGYIWMKSSYSGREKRVLLPSLSVPSHAKLVK